MRKLLQAVKRWHEPPERVYRQMMFFALRSRSYWCSECDTIGEDSRHCPRCQSSALLNLARVLPRHGDSIHLEAA
jgi:uncharacterized paraquat-inducible protein A